MDDPLEAERQRIGAEIHDGLLPYLFAAAAKTSSLRRSVAESGQSNSRLIESLAEVADWIDQSRQIARDLMNGLSLPPEAAEDPILAAQVFLNSIKVDSETTGRIVWKGCGVSVLTGRLDAEVAAATYRIVCESVRNSVRHAQAETINVICQRKSVSDEEECFHVEIRDDGIGMRESQRGSGAARGLGWMKMRADAVGIELRIESKIDQGTAVFLRIPARKTGAEKPVRE